MDGLAFLSVLIFVTLGIGFGKLGYVEASHQKRNAQLWFFICFLFNFWGYLILRCLRG